jgi:hypothetical protein
MDFPDIKPEEIKKLFRPGSVFDTTLVVCQCINCGHATSQSLRWFHEHGLVCSICGGRLDAEQFARAGKTVLEHYQATLQRFQRLRDPSS